MRTSFVSGVKLNAASNGSRTVMKVGNCTMTEPSATSARTP